MSQHHGCRDQCHASGNHEAKSRSRAQIFDLARIVPDLELPSAPRLAVDVGCGTGDDVRWLASAGFQVIGIDVSSTALQMAAEQTAAECRITWVQAPATEMPISDGSCVLVTDHGCMHHMAVDELPDYAAEVERVLVSGGAWVIRDLVGHGHQHRELDRIVIEQLAAGTSLRVETFEIASAEGHTGGHAALLAVLRRP